jgi:exodeoxyribonuclease VIII
MSLTNNDIITDDNYFQDTEYISSSMIKRALEGSKKHFDYAMANPIESEAFLVGSAFHAMMLEPDTFDKLFAFEPAMDRRTKAGKAYIAEWKEENKDIPNHVPGKYENMLYNMQESLNAHPTYSKLIVPGEGNREEILLFKHQDVKCKAKVDYFKDDYIVDIKTCASIKTLDIVESIKKYLYHIQAAFYLESKEEFKTFYFVFIEKKAPYDVLIVDFKGGLEDGRKCIEAGIANIKAFKETKHEDLMYAAFNQIVTI